MSHSKSRYLRLYEELSSSIRKQQYVAGDMLPTEAELCERYKVSRPTVAKALNLLVKEKLVHRRSGFGTQVLGPGKSALKVGLLIPQLQEIEIFDPICASLIESAGMEAMRIVRPTELSLKLDPRTMAETLTERFIEEKVHGVFFTPIEHIPCQQDFNLKIIRRLREKGIEVVLLDRDVYAWPRQTPHDLVGIDNIEAGYVMCGHLIENGCRNLAFVSAPDAAMTVELRRIGSREALVHNGRRGRDLKDVNLVVDQPEKTAKQLIKDKVDGVICANDVTAAPLLRALIDLGAEIPSKVKVCGFDDVKYASLLSVPLTSYHQPCVDIGKVAARVMLNRIKNPQSPYCRIALTGSIIVRSSSSAPAKK
ncbi:GntR family transcriptional regulator [Pelagicoccus sp. SDUM812005]|uniref:GntR family transcriptional regulator n=1 Tax=Pelagicoccus sp. SDUM812005 TaxID=3041257 RepID=UPI00280DFBF6|nr:GntR family transcriptional regulator [Pelagicoccus sp. SDUM812005]MDQ8182943.1 GntR family transcriptional regulator [Pelagicoccus sp. SDUM812005]